MCACSCAVAWREGRGGETDRTSGGRFALLDLLVLHLELIAVVHCSACASHGFPAKSVPTPYRPRSSRLQHLLVKLMRTLQPGCAAAGRLPLFQSLHQIAARVKGAIRFPLDEVSLSLRRQR